MRKLLILIALAFVWGVPADAKEKEHPALAVLRAQDEAWNRGDLEGFMAGYWRSPELTFYAGGGVRQGWDEVLARYRARYQGEGREMGRLSMGHLTAEPMGRRAALVRGRWRLDFADGTSTGGLFTVVMRKFPDGWKVVHDHTSVDGE
jgi:ketosteroid isomerase-like protein